MKTRSERLTVLLERAILVVVDAQNGFLDPNPGRPIPADVHDRLVRFTRFWAATDRPVAFCRFINEAGSILDETFPTMGMYAGSEKVEIPASLLAAAPKAKSSTTLQISTALRRISKDTCECCRMTPERLYLWATTPKPASITLP